jgi:hypothetical protein
MEIHSLKQAYTFIFSPTSNFESPPSFYLDARDTDAEIALSKHPQRRLIEQSPSGKALGNALENSLLRPDDKSRVLQAAAMKFLVVAKGDAEIIFGSPFPREDFLRKELPTLLSNPRIGTINGVSRAKLSALYEADPHEYKISALPFIVNSIQQRKLMPPSSSTPDYDKPFEVLVIERSMEGLLANDLKEIKARVEEARKNVQQAVRDWTKIDAEDRLAGAFPKTPERRIEILKEKQLAILRAGSKRETYESLKRSHREQAHSLLFGKYRAELTSILLQNSLQPEVSVSNSSPEHSQKVKPPPITTKPRVRVKM